MIKKSLIYIKIFVFAIIMSNKAIALDIDKIELFDTNFTKEVLNSLSVAVGDEINLNTSDEIIKSVFKTGLFEDVKVSIDNSTINIYLTDKPIIKSIKLSNYKNSILDNNKIDLLLKKYDLKKGSIYSEKSLLKLTQFLEQFYNEKGYLNFSVEEKIDIDKNNKVDINVVLNAAKPARVKLINIEGLSVFSEKEVLDLFDIGVSKNTIINYFTGKDIYRYIKVEQGLKNVINLYQNQGYFDFEITGIDIDISDDKESVYINFNIVEGKQHTLEEIIFIGDLKNKPINELVSMFDVSKGDLFKRDKLIKGIQSVKSFYENLGYANLEINYKTYLDEDSGAISLEIDITPKEMIYINTINISGNTRTKDKVIRREILLKEGSPYSLDAVDKSIVNIKKLGFFSNVVLEQEMVLNSENKIDLNIIVTEGNTGNIGLGISHTDTDGIIFNGYIQERNLLGTGNTIKARIKRLKEYNNISLFFKNPYFNEKHHSFNFNLSASTKISEKPSDSSYNINNSGLGAGYGIPIDDNSRLNIDLEYIKPKLQCGNTFKELYEPQQCGAIADDKKIVLTANWNKNTLNNYFNPTAGQENDINLDISIPNGEYKYFKLDIKHRSYSKITDNITLKLNAAAGLIAEYGDGYAPFYERYYSGGKSLRGFQTQTISPYYENSTKTKGGKFILSGSVNLISPVTFIKNSEKMRISAFVDFGNVYEEVSLNIAELRISAGLSFYYMSPVGGIGIYTAMPLIKKDGDETEKYAIFLENNF